MFACVHRERGRFVGNFVVFLGGVNDCEQPKNAADLRDQHGGRVQAGLPLEYFKKFGRALRKTDKHTHRQHQCLGTALICPVFSLHLPPSLKRGAVLCPRWVRCGTRSGSPLAWGSCPRSTRNHSLPGPTSPCLLKRTRAKNREIEG